MSSPLRISSLLWVVSLMACSSAPQGGDDAGDITEEDGGGGGTSVLRGFITSVYSVCPDAATPASACDANVRVIVTGPAGARVSDAVVTVNDQPLVSPGDDGSYAAIQTGFASAYRVVVTRGTDRLTATFTSPSDFTATLAAPSAANMPVTLTWSPTGEADVIAEVHIGDFSMQSEDTGEMILPGSVFPMPGTYSVSFSRNAFSGAGSSTILLVRPLTVTVP